MHAEDAASHAAQDAAHGAAHGIPFLTEILILLAAGLAAAPLCRRLNVSPVIGYLGVGVLLGPGGFGLVGEADSVRAIAELGVIFLLFSIGLELSLERLRALRTYIFGLGAAQMAVTGALIAALAYFWTQNVVAAVIVGMCFAFSSTAVAMQLLAERRETASAVGRIGFAVLLFQDLAVAPALLLVEVLGDAEGGLVSVFWSVGEALLRAVVAVALIVVMGRLVVRRLFRIIARERSADLFMGLVVLTALSTAWATQEAGLSPVLGAFLAGLLLAETEFRAQIETDIEPFKGLLLSLFFIGVGMSIDPRLILDQPLALLGAMAALIILKAAILFVLALAFRRPAAEAARVSLLLSQAGEFGFVLAGAALALGLVAPEIAQFSALVIAGSMLLSPALNALGRAIAARLTAPPPSREFAVQTSVGHVILAGYGRVGRLIAKAFSDCGVEWVAVERDAGIVQEALKEGAPVLFGDAARMELLERAGLQNAAALVITLDDPIAAERTLGAVQSRQPNVPVIVRARDDSLAPQLSAAGAHSVIPENLEPALQIATETLHIMGAASKDTLALVEDIRSAAATPVRRLPPGADGSAPKPEAPAASNESP